MILFDPVVCPLCQHTADDRESWRRHVDKHLRMPHCAPTVVERVPGAFWDVTCPCAWEITNLSSAEADVG